MKRLEILIIGGILVIATTIFLIQSRLASPVGGVAEVYVDGRIVERMSLYQVRTLKIETPYGCNVVEVSPEGARVVEADCRSQTCVRTPRQAASGAVIACLPHHLVVKIVAPVGDVDAVSR